MTRYQVHYQGLERRKTYDEILGYLERGGGPGVESSLAFPNRTASFIRNSPQYQNLLTMDFIDLQKQQENMLKQQKRDIIVKDPASGSDTKSVLASESPVESEASQHVQSDLSAVSAQSEFVDDIEDEMNEAIAQVVITKEIKQREMAVRGKAGMVDHVDAVTKLSDSFAAAKATGTEDYSGALGNKKDEKFIAEGQRLNLLRALPPNTKAPPPYISELPKDKVVVEMRRQHLGLTAFDPQTQAAMGTGSASSSSNPVGSAVQYNISSPRTDRSKSRDRSHSTKGTRGETRNPETNVAKSRGRPKYTLEQRAEADKLKAQKAAAKKSFNLILI